MKIGLLGGGITSLAIGYYLKKPYEILEKENRCGGLCRSLIDKGFTFDPYGAHILFSKNQKVLELEKKLVGKNLKYQLRISRIYYGNKLVKYPFENGLGELTPQDNFECLYNYLFNKYQAPPTNLEEWFYYTFGKGIAGKYLIPYNQKIWKMEPRLMGMEWVERIPKPPKEDIIKSALGIATEGYKHQLNFLYPEVGGVEAVIEAFLKNNKGIIRTNHDIKAIYYKNKKWIVGTNNGNYEYDYIVSTIPLFYLIKILKYIEIPKPVNKAINELEYRSLITVMLGLNTPKLNNLVAIYFPDKDFLPHRISFPPNFSSKTVPKNCFSLMAEITVPKNRKYLKFSKDKIYQNVIKGLEKRNIIKPNSVIYKNMQVTEYAYPVYDKSYVKNMKTIRDFLYSINLYVGGRFGGFEYINTDVCIEKGQRMAEILNKL
ncbi:MAG: FAD-dependent oxidoreductase [Patescibacteria group bacterium]|nr:FAD-dependent oxidoreductase [Patescibacteria group bacterium]